MSVWLLLQAFGQQQPKQITDHTNNRGMSSFIACNKLWVRRKLGNTCSFSLSPASPHVHPFTFSFTSMPVKRDILNKHTTPLT